MSEAIVKRVEIAACERVLNQYGTKTALFGIISYKYLIKSEKVGESLEILIDRVPEEVYINGKSYIPKNV